MKHYLSYDADGTIFGACSYSEAYTGLSGWPDVYEIDNPDTAHEPSRLWRASAKRPPTGGYLHYDCRCPRTARNCNCASVVRMANYVVEGRLTAKLATVVLLDGVEVEASGYTISRLPGSTVEVKVRIPGAPDGERIAVAQSARQVLATAELMVEMTTTNGALPDFDAYAPAQGIVGALRIFGRVCTLMEVRIRGWGS